MCAGGCSLHGLFEVWDARLSIQTGMERCMQDWCMHALHSAYCTLLTANPWLPAPLSCPTQSPLHDHLTSKARRVMLLFVHRMTPWRTVYEHLGR